MVWSRRNLVIGAAATQYSKHQSQIIQSKLLSSLCNFLKKLVSVFYLFQSRVYNCAGGKICTSERKILQMK